MQSRAADYLGFFFQKIMHALKRNPPYTKRDTFFIELQAVLEGYKIQKNIIERI